MQCTAHIHLLLLHNRQDFHKSENYPTNHQIMKFLTLLAAAMVNVAVADDRGVCKDWHPTIFNRINAFCLKTDIVVPSNYAEKGAGTNPTGRVWITSTYITHPETPLFLQTHSLNFLSYFSRSGNFERHRLQPSTMGSYRNLPKTILLRMRES